VQSTVLLEEILPRGAPDEAKVVEDLLNSLDIFKIGIGAGDIELEEY